MNLKNGLRKDGIDKYIDGELDEIADCFYNFAHGFFDLDKIGHPEKHLENVIFDEYGKEDGVLKKHFNKIYKLENKLEMFEEQARKDEKDFNPDETMVEELHTEYQYLIQDF